MQLVVPAAVLGLMLVACSSEPEPTTDVVARRTVDTTRIRVNGESSDVILSDPSTGTNGFLNVSRDQVADTTSLDFSYATPTSDPDIIILMQGAGEIPNSAYTTTTTSAHLVLATTPFPITRCEVNIVTAEFTCAEGDSIAFDLTWVQNGFAEVEESVRRTETLGPLTIKFNGTFDQRSALVNGFWNGNTAVDLSGNLLETKNTTVIREITMAVQ